MYQIGKAAGHDVDTGLENSLPFTKDWQSNRCLQETDIPEWMTKGKTTLIQRDYVDYQVTQQNSRFRLCGETKRSITE